MTYRTREPFLAIKSEGTKQFSCVTITPGSTIAVQGEVQQSGLVDVLYNGEILGAFMRDIQTRADLIEQKLGRLHSASQSPHE